MQNINNQSSLQNIKNPYTHNNYDLYQFQNKQIIVLVKKSSQQIAHVIGKKDKEDTTKVFNWFEAGKYKAMWNSQNKDQLFIRSLLLAKEENQQKIYNILKKNNAQKLQDKKNKFWVLNENIPDGEYIYTNNKNETFKIGILWGKTMNISHENQTLSGAQKSAITRAIKNYWTEKQTSKLQKIDIQTNQFDSFIDPNIPALWSDESENEIHNRLVKISTLNSQEISDDLIYELLNIYKYYASYANTHLEEQKSFLQNNDYIWLLFTWITYNLKKHLWEDANFHFWRLHQMKKLFEAYNKKNT